jgi:acyl-homoserine-lactone acylase
MKKILFALIAVSVSLASSTFHAQASAVTADTSDVARWQREAQAVTITRDDWGIPHVHGKTDADAVFGVIYAQAEDDFNRVEANYLDAVGRSAEADGESAIWRDLRMRLINDPADLKAQYQKAPAWLKTLMDAWADGLNYYLYTHPNVHPKVITDFEPWMPLAFSDGSIGPDIERVNLRDLASFYGTDGAALPGRRDPDAFVEPDGSNGIGISASITTDRHALLLINPHTSFFFREEAQMTSDEGLNAYGAITWGQFFVYQGWNDRTGWMHTSSGVDNIDEYLETVTKHGDHYTYKYGSEERPVQERKVTIKYKTGFDQGQKTFTIYSTQHGPIERQQDGKWVAMSLMQEPLNAIIESYVRTKATSYKAFLDSVNMRTDSSNNTLYADADGNIAYFHASYIPKRDPKFDWTKPVDGSDPATDYHGLLSIDEMPHLFNPANGWVYNSNNWPWSAAGPNSPKRTDYPAYVERGSEESPRGVHMLRVLTNQKGFSIEKLRATAFDSYLPSFAVMLPRLVKAWDDLPASDPLKAKLKDQIDTLRAWDFRWGVDSIPASLAEYWGEDVARRVGPDARKAGVSAETYIATQVPPESMLQSLDAATERLTSDFGTWKTRWGTINRLQRNNGDIVQRFDDSKPSIPVMFMSSRWGSLASFGARTYPGTKKMYGTTGNSFVAIVEFGPRVKAIAVTVGGLSSDPNSKHFNDQSERYATGNLRPVYFYPDELKGHVERDYHPGK